jgi:hypothetical protein
MPTIAEILASKHAKAAFDALAKGHHPKDVAAEALSGLAVERIQRALKAEPIQREVKGPSKEPGRVVDAEWRPL